ncbi:unnamed protein product, partial [Mesorhabditis spiculigera]
MKGPIAILGARSLLGRHVVNIFQELHPDIALEMWTQSDGVGNVNSVKRLIACISEAELIVNCHEARDLSMAPDLEALYSHNEQFVAEVLRNSTAPIIHISSTLVQCSDFWPNTYEPEREASKYESRWPCKAYCKSKHLAEQELFASRRSAVVLRIPFLYGEEDWGSPVTDAVMAANIFGSIPNIGDRGGAFQMAYAGNVANKVRLAAVELLKGSFREREIIIVGDDTPVGDVYDNVVEAVAKNPKRPMSTYNLPFLPLYYLYLVIGWLLLAVNKIFDVSGSLSKMPDPSLLYLIFHHWTFFNTNKSTNLLPDHEELSREYVVKKSRDHYALMNPNRVRTSWQLHIE